MDGGAGGVVAVVIGATVDVVVEPDAGRPGDSEAGFASGGEDEHPATSAAPTAPAAKTSRLDLLAIRARELLRGMRWGITDQGLPVHAGPTCPPMGPTPRRGS